MAGAAFAIALLGFHLALFTGLFLAARGRARLAGIAVGVALGLLAFVAFDLVRDPARERLAGLAMGLAFMFGLLWIGAAGVYTAVAAGGGDVGRTLAWLARRGRYWSAAGALGMIAFGVAFPRLRGFDGAGLPPGASEVVALLGLALALAALVLVFRGARRASRTLVEPGAPVGERLRAARRAAAYVWTSLALGVAGVVLLVAAGFP